MHGCRDIQNNRGQGRLVAKINRGAASENFSHCFNKQTIKKESYT